jgi:hypothetical protein
MSRLGFEKLIRIAQFNLNKLESNRLIVADIKDIKSVLK